MAKPYATEMARLAETFAWACTVDILALRQTIRTAGRSPLRAIGSGGSLTVAHALAHFHQRFSGQIAAVATPLEVLSEPLEAGVGTWLLSAGGGNVDVLAAAKALIAREPRQLVVLCGREDSPLALLCAEPTFVELLAFPPPAGKDGFLATNSLLGFTTLLARAYAAEFDAEAEWNDAKSRVEAMLADNAMLGTLWQTETDPLWSRPTTLVLHGPSTRIGAVDLESKFTEAALGNLQIADYRNFAHGRHHWLAKRGDVSAVLALVSDADEQLAMRTLALLPAHIPRAILHLGGSESAAALSSLVAAMRITGWAGVARGLDPGRPGVPEFGRKLYNLPLPKMGHATAVRGLSARDAAAIGRKSGQSPARLAARGELAPWRSALNAFRARLADAPIEGVVLDYDGTIVETRHRFCPATAAMAAQLIRIAESGAWLAIATGRGCSARRDLRARLPESLWSRVLVGYYNGAEIATLEDDETPKGSTSAGVSLAPVAAALRAQPELARCATQTDRPSQITLVATRPMPEHRLWEIAHHVVLQLGESDVSITRSSHSIDVVPLGVSKCNVLKRMRERVGADAALLTIGDRGRWPGNDHDLLRGAYALSVDETNADPTTCWNLGRPGQRGTGVTLNYLSALQPSGGVLSFAPEALT